MAPDGWYDAQDVANAVAGQQIDVAIAALDEIVATWTWQTPTA